MLFLIAALAVGRLEDVCKRGWMRLRMASIALPAVAFWRSTPMRMAATTMFVLCYVCGYARIVRSRAPDLRRMRRASGTEGRP